MTYTDIMLRLNSWLQRTYFSDNPNAGVHYNIDKIWTAMDYWTCLYINTETDYWLKLKSVRFRFYPIETCILESIKGSKKGLWSYCHCVKNYYHSSTPILLIFQKVEREIFDSTQVCINSKVLINLYAFLEICNNNTLSTWIDG